MVDLAACGEGRHQVDVAGEEEWDSDMTGRGDRHRDRLMPRRASGPDRYGAVGGVKTGAPQLGVDPVANLEVVLTHLASDSRALGGGGMLADPEMQHVADLERGAEHGNDDEDDREDRLQRLLPSRIRETHEPGVPTRRLLR